MFSFFPGYASSHPALVPVYPHNVCTFAPNILKSNLVSSLVVEASKKGPPVVVGRGVSNGAKLVYISSTFELAMLAGNPIQGLGSVDAVCRYQPGARALKVEVAYLPIKEREISTFSPTRSRTLSNTVSHATASGHLLMTPSIT